MSLSKLFPPRYALAIANNVAVRSLSAQSQAQSDLKPYHEIPGLKGLPVVGAVHKLTAKPHGYERFPLNLLKYQEEISNGTGLLRMDSKIVSNMEGSDGRALWVFKPELVEAVIRAEGKYPNRGEFFGSLRLWKLSRPDIFLGNTGVLLEEGEKWQEIRSKVQQDMMRPKSAMHYIEPLEQVVEEFFEYVDRELAATPDKATIENFTPDLYKYALEAIVMIALDRKLGAFEENLTEETAEMIRHVKSMFEALGEVQLGIPVHKISPILSPSFRRLCKHLDGCAAFIHVTLHNLHN